MTPAEASKDHRWSIQTRRRCPATSRWTQRRRKAPGRHRRPQCGRRVDRGARVHQQSVQGPAPAGAPGDFATTHVGDEWDTSPFPNTTVQGISTATYIRRMTTLIKALETTRTEPTSRAPITWRLDNLGTIGGHAARSVGSPGIVQTSSGSALEFDGVDDSIVVDSNPLEGLQAFTLEVELWPSPGGPEEQRFVHVGEDGTDNRAMMETRMLPGRRWSLDTFLLGRPSHVVRCRENARRRRVARRPLADGAR